MNKETLSFVTPPSAEKLQNFFGVFLQFQIGVDTDKVAAVMEECRLYKNRQEGRKSYYHVYSMDCSPGIENHAMFLVQSPEDLIIQEIDEAAEGLLLEHLAEAITHLSPTQARRLHARYALEKKFREIAADEGISGKLCL